MVFSIRGDVLDSLGSDFHLNRQQTGVLLSPAFWGFTVSVLIGGSLVDFFGMRRLLMMSGFGYVAAILAIIFAPKPTGPVTPYYSDTGFLILYASMMTLGLAQGLVEGVINPLCAALYPSDKTRRLNVLHAWWPGGLIIGGLIAVAMTAARLGWQLKMATILITAGAYLVMIRRQEFPPTERVAAGVPASRMVRETARPMFMLLWVCMWMTAATELGPDQWVGSLITSLTGMQGILILVYTAGIGFALRFFGGSLSHYLSPMGLLAICALLSALGLYGLSLASSVTQVFAAATLFGVGKAFFWPVMLGVTSERFPKGGALLLAIMGGTGNLAVAFVLPIMGQRYDEAGAAAAFRDVAILPMILTVIFGALYFYYRAKGGYRPTAIETISVSSRAFD